MAEEKLLGGVFRKSSKLCCRIGPPRSSCLFMIRNPAAEQPVCFHIKDFLKQLWPLHEQSGCLLSHVPRPRGLWWDTAFLIPLNQACRKIFRGHRHVTLHPVVSQSAWVGLVSTWIKLRNLAAKAFEEEWGLLLSSHTGWNGDEFWRVATISC